MSAASRGQSRGRRQPTTWDRLERPPLAAYCRWRQAEALVTPGASRAEANLPLREAHAVADRIGAQPLLPLSSNCSPSAPGSISLAPARAVNRSTTEPRRSTSASRRASPRSSPLVARGHTNREIAETLIISAKTASVHVSHILHKLQAPEPAGSGSDRSPPHRHARS